MEKTYVLQDLLSLCRRHLQLVIEEKWEQWESALNKKKFLYGKLKQLKGISLSDGEEEILLEIRRLEREINREIKSKREETRKELDRTNRVKGVLKGYKKATHHKTKRNGLRLEA